MAPTAVLAVLTASTVSVHRLLPRRWHVPANLATAAVVLGIALAAGADAEDLGLSRDRVGAGLRWGALTGGGAALAVGAVAAAAPHAAGDGRARALSPTEVLREVAWRIPVGTVLPEELAFRSVLPAVLARPDRPDWWPDAVSSALFGLWHTASAPQLARSNPAASGAVARVGPSTALAAHVAATGLAGAALHQLRRRSRSVLAPALAHLAINVAGVAAARAVGHRRA